MPPEAMNELMSTEPWLIYTPLQNPSLQIHMLLRPPSACSLSRRSLSASKNGTKGELLFCTGRLSQKCRIIHTIIAESHSASPTFEEAVHRFFTTCNLNIRGANQVLGFTGPAIDSGNLNQ